MLMSVSTDSEDFVTKRMPTRGEHDGMITKAKVKTDTDESDEKMTSDARRRSLERTMGSTSGEEFLIINTEERGWSGGVQGLKEE